MKNLLLAAAIGFSAMSCTDRTKDEPKDQLPPISQTGANTAGCLVDGKVLIPKDGSQNIGGSPAFGLTTGTGNDFWPNKNDYIYFKITNYQDTHCGDLYIYIKNMSKGVGDYIVNQSDGNYAYYGDVSANNNMTLRITRNNENKVYYSSDNCGIISFSRTDLSYGVSIYSATFSATLYNKDNPSDKIKITDGRFDINRLTLNK